MLPKIQHPAFPILVPSLKKASRFRPFTVKEEKILLMARESTEPEVDFLRAIHQVVNNCAVDPLDADQLATFDLEWLFVKLRESSVGASCGTKSFVDIEERDKGVTPLPTYDFDINLSLVKAPVLSEGSLIFMANETEGVEMRYPPASLFLDPEFGKGDADTVLFRSTKRIFTVGGESYEASQSTQTEVIEYFEGWTTQAIEPVRKFLADVPTMALELSYTNSFGSEKKVRLTSLSDFFTFA